MLILKALMVAIKQKLTTKGVPFDELHPYHVFQLVAGTSTGRLIALMLGKMVMTVDECNTQYEALSKVIFGRKHLRGRMTHGLAPTKYSGKRLQKCIQDLLRERQLDEDLSMRHEADWIAWYVLAMLRSFQPHVPALNSQDEAHFANMSIISAVVCREHCSSSQYSKLLPKPVLICSLPCNNTLTCTVCQAARATSAAPTFFPVMRLENRFFTDGGLGNNNPSFAIYFHYSANQRKKSAKPTAASADSAPPFSSYGDLDFSYVRFINIGTGAKVDEVEPRKRAWLANLIPSFIRKGVFLKQTLTEIAVGSDCKIEMMREFQGMTLNKFMYERFDANHGVSNIKLDDYNALGDIRQKTEQYLDEQEIKDLLEEVGSAIATDYLKSRPIHEQDVQPAELVIEKSRQPLTTLSIILGPSSLSRDQSSHSSYPETDTHILFPNHDNLQYDGSRPWHQGAEYPAETHLPLDGQGQSKDYAHTDSGIDVIESDPPMAQ